MTHSDILDEAVSQDADFDFGIKFYETSSFTTEKTDDFEIGKMIYLEVNPSVPLIDELDFAVQTCRMTYNQLSYAFYENVSFFSIELDDNCEFDKIV